MVTIIFVCTGNMFRSLSAQLALQSILPPDAQWAVASAGTHVKTDFQLGRHIRTDIRERLQHWQSDPGNHQPRLLTQEIINSADLIIAMNSDHQAYIAEQFGRHAPLYLEIATGEAQDFPDLPDVVPNYKEDRPAANTYIYTSIDKIFGYREEFLRRLPAYLPPPNPVSTPPPSAPAP